MSDFAREVGAMVPFVKNTYELITGTSYFEPNKPVSRWKAFENLALEVVMTVATMPAGGAGGVARAVATSVRAEVNMTAKVLQQTLAKQAVAKQSARAAKTLTVDDFMAQAQARLNSVKAEFGNVEAFNMAGRPANMAPAGAGRTGALRSALRANGVPTSMTPSRVLPNLDRRGNIQPGRVYEYDVPAPGGGTRKVRIRDDSGGHDFGPGDPQNRGAHFNDEFGNHYDY